MGSAAGYQRDASGQLVNTNTGEYELILAARAKRREHRDVVARLDRLEALVEALLAERGTGT